MNIKAHFHIVSYTILTILLSSSCSNKPCECSKIDSEYASELSLKLSAQTKNLKHDLTYVYHRFDLAQIGIKTGSRNQSDTIFIDKAIDLQNSSSHVWEIVTDMLYKNNLSIHKLEVEIEAHQKAVEVILDGVIGQGSFGQSDKKYISEKFDNLNISIFKKIDHNELLIERELLLQKLVEIELVCAELLLHKLW